MNRILDFGFQVLDLNLTLDMDLRLLPGITAVSDERRSPIANQESKMEGPR